MYNNTGIAMISQSATESITPAMETPAVVLEPEARWVTSSARAKETVRLSRQISAMMVAAIPSPPTVSAVTANGLLSAIPRLFS